MGDIKKKETYIMSSNGKDRLHVVVWEPEGEKKGVVQLSHGMIEMVDKYDVFARYLADRGFVVAGNDHLGHGLTAADTKELGYMNAYDASRAMVTDLHRVTRCLKRAYGPIPFFIIAHSMGSFLVRRYMTEYGYDSLYPSPYTKGSSIDGYILLGTGSKSDMEISAGKLVYSLEKHRHGERYRSLLMDILAFGTYNKGIPKEMVVDGQVRQRTAGDWCSTDTKMVDEYIDHPLCKFTFTLKGYDTLFNTLRFIQDERNIARIPKDVPVLFASGDKDPVGHFGKDVPKLYELYHNKVTRNVSLYMYEGCRHEILREVCRQQVYEDIYDWLTTTMSGFDK